MNENAKKWVEALRSGQYPQGRNHLRTDKGFCCLGVACDLFAKDNPDTSLSWVTDSPEVGGFGHTPDDADFEFLPVPVQIWLGITSNDGSLKFGESLALLNDQGLSFEEIAAVIEEYADYLFDDPEPDDELVLA